MDLNLTEVERKLVGFFLGCHIDDRITEAKKKRFNAQHPYCQQIAEMQRITYTKIIPEALVGDLILADGTVLKKERNKQA